MTTGPTESTAGPAGRTRVVLAPGFDGTGELFAPLVTALGENVPAVVVRYPADLPGTLDAYVAHLESSLDRTRPFVMVAESFSGPIALECLRRDPTGCRGLLLLATFVADPRPWYTWLGTTLLRPFLFIAPPRWALRRYLVGRDADPAVVETLMRIGRTLPRRTIAARLRLLRSLHANESVFDFPVRYLRATGDRVVLRDASDECVRRVRGARMIDLPGAHLLAQHSPVAVADHLRELLD